MARIQRLQLQMQGITHIEGDARTVDANRGIAPLAFQVQPPRRALGALRRPLQERFHPLGIIRHPVGEAAAVQRLTPQQLAGGGISGEDAPLGIAQQASDSQGTAQAAEGLDEIHTHGNSRKYSRPSSATVAPSSRKWITTRQPASPRAWIRSSTTLA